jgi:replication-associated recombination protein RarA
LHKLTFRVINIMDKLYGYEVIEERLNKFYDHPGHIFLTGQQGSGKTSIINNFLRNYFIHHYGSVADNLSNESDIFFMNSHQDRGIHTVRNVLLDYVRQPARKSKCVRWVVIDHLESFPELSQQALRRPMELYSHVACFIFIGNNKSNLIPPLLSRCHCISLPDLNLSMIAKQLQIKYNLPENAIGEETTMWLITHSNNIIREYCQYIKLLVNFFNKTSQPLSKIQAHDLVLELCSIPSFDIYYPLIASLLQKNTCEIFKNLTRLWIAGESFEDVFDSVKKTVYMFGYGSLHEGESIYAFLMRGWIQYSQGYTSYRSLLLTSFPSH